MIINGWFDWAAGRVPGPSDKIYSTVNMAEGVVPHSMVGYYPAWLRRLQSTERKDDGRYTDFAAASIQGAVLYDGRLIQHYPLMASCWGSGSRYPNTHFNAYEFEGGPPGNESEPFTVPQMNTLVRIIKETSEWRRWSPTRPVNAVDIAATLYEHNECRRWGSRPTACPSNRVPWGVILERLKEGGMPTPSEILVTELFLEAAKKALAGVQLTSDERAKIRYIMGCN